MPKVKAQELLKQLPNWQLGTKNVQKDGNVKKNDNVKKDDAQIAVEHAEEIVVDYIYCTYNFKNYYKTMGFVNAIAWMAHQENHHPDIMIGYDHCTVQYSTHAILGLSENDFICAAKVNQLFTPSP